MTALLRSWATDPAVGAVLIDGAGERAFCAGGDIRALYDAAKSGDPLPAQFWATEYQLNVLIARYPKPVIAIMDGAGDGRRRRAFGACRASRRHRSLRGRHAGSRHRILSRCRRVLSVGARARMRRAPTLALTGNRAGAADAIYCGLADVHVPAAKLAEIPAALADCRTGDDVQGRASANYRPPLPPVT